MSAAVDVTRRAQLAAACARWTEAARKRGDDESWRAFAAACGVSSEYLWQVREAWRGRGLGTRTARRIEQRLGLAAGALDQPLTAPRRVSARRAALVELLEGLDARALADVLEFIRARTGAELRTPRAKARP